MANDFIFVIRFLRTFLSEFVLIVFCSVFKVDRRLLMDTKIKTVVYTVTNYAARRNGRRGMRAKRR